MGRFLGIFRKHRVQTGFTFSASVFHQQLFWNMKTNLASLLLAVLGLGGCVSIRSSREPAATPPAFDNVLVVVKQKDQAQRFANQFRFAFPPGYQVTPLGIDDLSFGNPDSLVRAKVREVGANAVLWLENRPSGVVTGSQYYTTTLFELYGELRTPPTNQPIWKVKMNKAPARANFPPERVVSQMLRDGVLRKSGPGLATNAAR